MVFSSVIFIFYFLPIFLVVYFLTGTRNAVLLTGSAIFYVWGEGPYLFLLIALLVLNRFAGISIGRLRGLPRILVLIASISVNLIVLAIFKYSQFIIDIVASIGHFHAPHLAIHLPLGISFFTFQLVSYLIEVNRKSIEPERSFVCLATYVMMFPHLIAGPIVRYTDIEGELHSRSVDAGKIAIGIQYFIVGLSQKVLIANSVAPAADHLFGLPINAIPSSTAWIGTLGYTLQIYFDFCGYSNMAIGLAFMLGFRFPMNFDYPYASMSITEFWRRWHMSLSFWFRDYVYIPLGGSRQGEFATLRNLLIVFLVTGLWHGAAWTFVFWGLWHGFFVIIERVFLKPILEVGPSLIARLYTLIVVIVGWIFFRADSFNRAVSILKSMCGFGVKTTGWNPMMTWMTPETIGALSAGVILSFPVLPVLFKRLGMRSTNGPTRPGMRGLHPQQVHVLPAWLLIFSFVCCLFLLATNTLNPFLYFRF